MTDTPNNEDPKPQDPQGGDGEGKVTFSKEQQDQIDKIIADRLKKSSDKSNKELEDLKAKHKLELEENEKKSKLKADELKEYENNKTLEELKILKAEKEKRDFLDNSKVVLDDCKVDGKMQFLFENEISLDDVKAKAEKFVKLFNDAVLEEVNKRMGGHQQKTGTNNPEDNSAMRKAMGLK